MYIFRLFILILLNASIFAVEIPAKPIDTRIVDLAQIFTAEQKSRLNIQLENIYQKRNKTIVAILTVNSINKQDINQFSLDVARKWGIGQKDKNNGILILIVREEKLTRIEVGYGLEGILPDGLIGNIQREIINPNFKNAAYYLAMTKTLDVINQKISQEYKHKATNNKFTLNDYIFIIFILLIVIILIATGNFGLVFNLLLLVFQVFGKARNGKDIGNGGGFGGGGSSSRW